MQIIDPRYWISYWRVQRDLLTYPLYDVPHKFREHDLSVSAATENFEYFMNKRRERLDHFIDWLNKKFKISAEVSPSGILAVDRWFNHFGGGLIANTPDRVAVFANYAAPWTNKFSGLNCIIDVGIFTGEYLLYKRPELYWEMYAGHKKDPATFEAIGFRRPVIAGFPLGQIKDVLTLAYGIAADKRNLNIVTQINHIDRSNTLVRHVKSTLQLARIASDSKEPIVGDYENEPL